MNSSTPDNHVNASAPSNQKEEQPHDHLIKLPGGSWGVWQWACVRGAGFPARMVLGLAASPENITAADAVLAAEDYTQHISKLAIAELAKQLEQTPEKERKPLKKVLRQIRNGQLSSRSKIQLPVLIQLYQAQEDTDTLRSEFEQKMVQDVCRINETFRKFLKNDAFQEAMLWQNRHIFQRIDWFLRQPVTRTNNRARETERLLANYLQRYCVKNDTIGFFGPAGWGKVESHSSGEEYIKNPATAIAFQPGKHLITNRQVFFEQWCLDALAENLSQREDLHPWLPLCPLPVFYLDGTILHLPLVAAWLRKGKIPSVIKSRIQLLPVQYRLLQLCDGKRPAKEIAQEILSNPTFKLIEETEIYQLLDQLCDLGVLRWGIELPLELYPERTLRSHLERIADVTLRKSALSDLNKLEAARNSVAEAAGDPTRLKQALQAFDSTFICLTDVAPTRSEGKFYAGRTLIYEECRRDMTLIFGPELLSKLGPPLSLLLTSTRWFTYRVAQVYREEFTARYDRFVQEHEESQVDLQSFLTHILPLLEDECNPLLTMVVRELQQHWRDIFLKFPLSFEEEYRDEGEKRYLSYTSQDLSPHVQVVFDAPHCGWTLARYRSPDIMLAAPDVEAVQQGNYQCILGELHLCNTVDNASLIEQHPHAEELVKAYEQDISTPCVIPVASKKWSSQRNLSVLSFSKDIRFAFESIPSNIPRSQIVTVGELIVEKSESSLHVCTRDHRFRWDIIDFFGYTLSNQCIAFPSLLPAASHSPRITIDDLIVCRESWNVTPAELPFAQLLTRSDQLLAVRRWAKENSIPRFIFVKAAHEPKPFFVDLESPIYIDILAKIVRQQASNSTPGETIRITEMLPDFDQLWLNDTADNRYTSELRFVMFDG